MRRPGRASRASLSRGFGWLSREIRIGVLYSDTLSARDVAFGPRPTGSLTATVLGDNGSAPPRVSTLTSSSVSRCLGPCVRSFTGSSQQSPAPWLTLAPSATPRRFPIQKKGMSTSLTRLFGVHQDRTTLTRNHTLSRTLSGHTPQWLPNWFCPNG